MADRNKLSQIEKKMDMSLDEIIKANKSKASGGVRKPGAGQGAKPGRAPLVMGKGQAGGKGKAQAPKSLAPKAGVAGKRQAIQQKRAAGKATTGVRVKPSTGGIAKVAPKRAGSMAQKILNKARQSKQQAPKQLGGKPRLAQQAPKQLSTTKQARKPVQFNGNAKQQPQRQQQQQMSAPKSLAQRMNQQRRGGNQNVGKQQAPARAPLRLGNGGGNGHRRGGGGGPAPMQLDRPMAGGVRKRQQRAPIFQQSRAQQYQHQQVARQVPIHQHQQQRVPLGPRMGGTSMQPRMAPISNARGYRGAPMQQQQMRAPRMPINLVDTAKQQAALQALRLQQMEEERNRAERRLYMHQQMEMLGAPTRSGPRQGGAGYGGSEGVRGMGGVASGGYREASRAPVVLNGRMGNSSRGSYGRYADYA